jgi:hypothetical protein
MMLSSVHYLCGSKEQQSRYTQLLRTYTRLVLSFIPRNSSVPFLITPSYFPAQGRLHIVPAMAEEDQAIMSTQLFTPEQCTWLHKSFGAGTSHQASS